MLPWPEIMTTGTSGCSALRTSRSCSPSRREPCIQMSRNTSWGRRRSTAARASSESFAVRAPWPSSSRMPATRSRMSASSSTISMSLAIVLPLLHALRLGRLAPVRTIGREPQAHHRAPAAGRDRRGIEELDAAAMLFHDPPHDREPEPGSLLARGDVGLQQPLPILLRQTDTVVRHLDSNVGAVAHDRDGHMSLSALGLGHAGDRL